MTLGIGFIGAGNINRNHMKSAKQLGLDLLGVADVHLPAAEAAAKDFGIRRACADFSELLSDPQVQAVVIGTPNKFHADQAVAALKAGKHVLLEKPMAMNVAESDAIVAAARASGTILQMGMVNRFKAGPLTVKKFIDAGRCGSIYAGQAWWYRRRGIPGFGGWFTQKSMSGGGALIDIGVHLLDLTLHLMGFPRPVAVSGMTYNIWKNLKDYTYVKMWGKPTPGGRKDVDDYARGAIRFADGQTLQLNVSWSINSDSSGHDQGVRVIGDKGGVSLLGMDNPQVHTEEDGHIVDIKPHFASNEPMLEEMRHFVECIRDGRTPIATAEQGRTVQAILDAIYRSSEQRCEVVVE